MCVQIAYPLVYSLLVEEPDFVKWDDALAFRKTQRSEDNIEAFRDEFDNAQENEAFNGIINCRENRKHLIKFFFKDLK